MSVFEELKRRNVFRVAIAYLIAAWLVLQVSDLVLEAIEAPAWVLKVFLLIFALGFPIAVIFSWAYELTPEGIKREKEVDRTESVTHDTGKKLNQITIGMVIALALFIAFDRMVQPQPATDAQDDSSVPVAAEKSIAVLAFEDLSPGGDQEYFADGLSEELLNVLAQNPDLQVAGRTSSFAFKGQNRDLREIGEILNVAHILEGSVRKAGNKIRVTAQLINAETGFHLFSETYDRDLIDVFAVQDEIAASISGTLHTELVGTVTKQTAETSIEAYDLYLIARQKIYTRDREEMEDAARLLDQALELDSEYAPALVQRALAWHLLSDSFGSYGDIPAEDADARAQVLVDKAIAIDPSLADAYAVQGLLLISGDEIADNPEAIAKLEHAQSLNPNLDNMRNWLSTAYARAGRQEEAQALLESAVERDPLYGPAFNNLIGSYLTRSNFDRANGLVGRVERIVGETLDVQQAWGTIAVSQGESARAIRYLRRVHEANPDDSVGVLYYMFALGQIGDFETLLEVRDPVGNVYSLIRLGRSDEAQSALDALADDVSKEDTFNAQVTIFDEVKNYQGIVDTVTDLYGSAEIYIAETEEPDGGNSGQLATIAYAYLQLGRDAEFQRMVTALSRSVDIRAENRQTNYPAIQRAVELALLTGSDEEVLTQLRRAVARGYTSVRPFDGAFFDRMQDNKEFQELREGVLKRANSERAKLGLEPYQAPLPIT